MKGVRFLGVVLVAACAACGGEPLDEPVYPDESSLSIVHVDGDGNEFVVTVTTSEPVSVVTMDSLVSNIAVVAASDGIELVDESSFEGTIHPSDPHWELHDHSIDVDIEPLSYDSFDYIDRYRWEWIDVEQLTEFCPPGH
jgi:hypothetical protein